MTENNIPAGTQNKIQDNDQADNQNPNKVQKSDNLSDSDQINHAKKSTANKISNKNLIASIIALCSVLVLFLVFAIGYIHKNFYPAQNTDKISKNTSKNSSTNSIENGKYKELPFEKLELADTREKQNKGMMYRTEMCQTCGILFLFDQPQAGAFWMKNTYISLDIIFVDQDGKIIKIHPSTVPLQTDPDYSPDGEYLYTIEFLAGYSQKYNLKEGDYLNMPKIIKKTVPYDNSFMPKNEI